MEISKTIYLKDRRSWHASLAKNHKRKSDIWLVFYRKAAGKPRILYDDAVEEALSYGWIDSQLKNIDGERFAQRFSKRKPGSGLSQMNLERVRKLVAQKKMTKDGLTAIAHAFNPEKDSFSAFTVSPGILKALKADKAAWQNFKKLPGSYKRVRVAFIESRKRHGISRYRKSLEHFIKMTAQNKRFGFVRPDR